MRPLTNDDAVRAIQRELDAHPTWRAAYDAGVVDAAIAACDGCAERDEAGEPR